MKITIEQIAELAQECEGEYFIWEELSVDRDEAYQLMASHVKEIMDSNDDSKLPIVLASVTTQLLVENFILNLKNQRLQKGQGV